MRSTRRLPLLPLAPLLVVLFGFSTAVLVIVYGSRQLQLASDSEAAHQATAIAGAMAARLRLTASEDRSPVIAEATATGIAELLLVAQDGQIVQSGSLEEFSREERTDMLIAGEGFVATTSGRQRYASRPLGPPFEHLSVVALVAAPENPPEALALGSAVAALAALLLGAAVAVSISYARAAHDEIDYVQRRIQEMAGLDGEPAAELVAVRALDEIGVLTSAFNTLVERFVAADRSYRADLAEAARIDEERLQFLAGLSHELRTPLNAVLGFSHVLESEVEGPLDDDSRESVQIIRTSAEHLRTLIDDILDLSALETGKLKLSRRPVEVQVIAEEVVREAAALARNKGLELMVLPTGSGILCHADRRRVRQILTNLVANAVKFTAEGTVRVEIERQEENAVIRVIDTGPGIALHERSVIFEAYRQSTDARLRQGGTGLGLATVKQLVELHGGTIGVEAAPGGGSVFAFTLPLASEQELEDSRDGRASMPSLPPSALQGPRS